MLILKNVCTAANRGNISFQDLPILILFSPSPKKKSTEQSAKLLYFGKTTICNIWINNYDPGFQSAFQPVVWEFHLYKSFCVAIFAPLNTTGINTPCFLAFHKGACHKSKVLESVG